MGSRVTTWADLGCEAGRDRRTAELKGPKGPRKWSGRQSAVHRTGRPLPAPSLQGFPPQVLPPIPAQTFPLWRAGCRVSQESPLLPSSQGQEMQIVISPETQSWWRSSRWWEC